MAREHAPLMVVAKAQQTAADAREASAGRHPNPVVDWGRETVQTGRATGSQDIVTATLPIDIVRPKAQRALVSADAAWQRAEAAQTEANAVLEALLAFYEVALAEQRVALLQAAVDNLEEAARVLRSRERAGAISGYEASRLSIARELGISTHAEAVAQLSAARIALARYLGREPSEVAVATDALAISVSKNGQTDTTLPAVQKAQESVERAHEAEAHTEWAWLPTLAVGGGIKRVSDLGGGVGYVFGLSVGLPIFDRGQSLRAEARAQSALTAARAGELSHKLDVQAESARVIFESATAELERFTAQTGSHVETLLLAATSGYGEGERTILELLDAQQAQTKVAERRLTLSLSAKRAEALLRAATGAF